MWRFKANLSLKLPEQILHLYGLIPVENVSQLLSGSFRDLETYRDELSRDSLDELLVRRQNYISRTCRASRCEMKRYYRRITSEKVDFLTPCVSSDDSIVLHDERIPYRRFDRHKAFH